MVKFIIEVINVSQPRFTKTAGGGYSAVEVAYKRDGKTDGKKLVDFNSKDSPGGKAVYELFLKAKEGQTYEVEAQKGEKFWNWVAATPITVEKESAGSGDGAQSDTSSPGDTGGDEPKGRAPSKPSGRVTGSNYETPIERAKRQRYIVRQSSFTNALELLKANTTPQVTPSGNIIPVTAQQVIAVAKEIEAYVFSPTGKFDDMDDDIPF
jgi:hypothetical protein